MISDVPAGLASFRDPAGSVIQTAGRVFRIVRPCGFRNVDAFFDSPAVIRSMNDGSIIRTWRAASGLSTSLPETDPTGCVILEHERIPFQSFPYEWAPEMLYHAGILTLDLCEQLLDEGNCLKDATPYNILFRATKPVLVDVLSIEPRDPCDPVWLPYAQFMTSFILPLLAYRKFGLTLDQVFLSRRDGLKPEELYRLCSTGRKLDPSILFNIVLPTWLGRVSRLNDDGLYQKRSNPESQRARFVLSGVLASLRRKLRAVSPPRNSESNWTNYESQNSYSREEMERKQAFVNKVLERLRPKMVLDVGCNTGAFSQLAAQQRATVVAIDSDPVVVGRAFTRAKDEALEILPLVVDISRPTPAVGWNNTECTSFLTRASQRFDLVLMLAVVHHLIVTERIPLIKIAELVAYLSNEFALIEYIAPGDSMFRKLVRGRDELYADLTERLFLSSFQEQFSVLDSVPLSQTRSLYLLRKKK